MRGEILSYDDIQGVGLISGDDGVRYGFSRADLQQLTPVRAGTKVDFVALDGAATQIFVVADAASAPSGFTPGVAGSGPSLDWRKLFLDANGRIGQKDFWIGFAIVFVANLVLSWIPLLGFVISLLLFYAWVCVASKRLHDMGRSGWLAAIPVALGVLSLMMMVGSVVGGMMSAGYDGGAGMMIGMGGAGLIAGLAFLVNIAFVIWLGVTPGQAGDNRYGPPPAPLVNA